MSSAPASAPPVPGTASPVLAGRRAGPFIFAGCYLTLFLAGQGAYLILSPAARAAFLAFASTDVANLTRDPLGCLVLSAFVTGASVVSTVTWLPLIAIALCAAARAVGPWRAAAVAAAGHVIGTLVSEGLVAWRISSGALPGSDRYLTDVGPSYVVVSTLVLAMLCLPWARFRWPRSEGGAWSRNDRASWTWRSLAAVAMLLLIFPGQIFSGLFSLDVAAVGHATAITTAAFAAFFLRRHKRSLPDKLPCPERA